MKKRAFIALSLISFLFTSCAAVPQGVRDNADRYGSNSSKNKEEIEYCDIDELKKIDMDNIEVPDANIVFPEEVDFSDVESVYDLDLYFRSKSSMDTDSYANCFGMDEKLSCEHMEGVLKGDSGTVIKSQSGESLYIGDSGTISYIGKNYSYNDNSLQEVTSRKVYLKQGGSTEEMVTFPSGEVSLEQLIMDYETWFKESPMNYELKPEIRSAYIYETPDGMDLVSMYGMLLLDGMPLDYYGGGKLEMVDGMYGKLMSINAYQQVVLSDQDAYDFYYLSEDYEVDNKSPLNQVVDFQSAVNIVCEEMSGFNQLEIVEVEPVYVLSPEYDPTNNEYYATAGNRVEATPVYSFMVRIGDTNDEVDNLYDRLESDEYCYINVSMIDGSLSTNFAERGYNP